MKHLLLSASLLLISFAAYGQTNSPPAQPCTLKIAQAPAVRGVKLGMMLDEVLPLFPGTSESGAVKHALSTAEGYPNFGYAYVGLDPSSWGNAERFAGINSYFISTFDRRIVGVTITYKQFPEGAHWKNAHNRATVSSFRPEMLSALFAKDCTVVQASPLPRVMAERLASPRCGPLGTTQPLASATSLILKRI